jgi:transposase
MLLKTLLNKVERFKSFVFGQVQLTWVNRQEALIIEIEPRRNGRPVCSRCGKSAPGYDREKKPRLFEYVPLWAFKVYFSYRMRRVSCPIDGVVVERVPWAEGKQEQTMTLQVFLARWARRLSWKETAEVFGTSWDAVFRAVKRMVDFGHAHKDWSGITCIGIDEIAVFRGHKYLTLVYQLDAGVRRLLWVGVGRTKKTLGEFFKELGKERSALLEYVMTDMWQAYVNVVLAKAKNALLVLDRFHIMKKMNEAIDMVRRQEARKLTKRYGREHVLVGSRWLLLKRITNLTRKESRRLSELLTFNLKTVKAHLLREDFQQFWECRYVSQAANFLDDWIRRTKRTSIEPMKKVAKTLQTHRSLILNWFYARDEALALGAVEGFNTRAKLTTRKAFGFRSEEIVILQLYHVLGRLPLPKIAHRFC